MNRVLIICDRFPPAFAPRMGYLVKYLNDYGWTADIVTENNSGENNFHSLEVKENLIKVTLDTEVIPSDNVGKFKNLVTNKGRFISKKIPFIETILNKLNPEDYSVILVSMAWKLYVFFAAIEIASKWRKPLIADFRDIYEQRPKEPLVNKGIKRFFIDFFLQSFDKRILGLRNKYLARVSAVTTVSPWHVGQLLKYNPKVNLIYNGFDPETYFPDVNHSQVQFKIVYTGSINSVALRDPTLLFKSVHRLHVEKRIDPLVFRLQFYIPERDRTLLYNMPDYNSISQYVDFYKFVDHSRVPLILNDSCIVLLLTNLTNEDGPKGVISTTRFFEYLGVERPILCVRSDESLMEEGIIEAKAGVSARSVDEAYNFILDKWDEWRVRGYTTVEINQKYKQQFSRKLQAKQFADIFEKVYKEWE